MADDRSERRSETAKRNDDSHLIEDKVETPDQQGRSGGNLQRDVGTADPKKDVRDPDARDRLTKEQELRHGGSSSADDQGAT